MKPVLHCLAGPCRRHTAQARRRGGILIFVMVIVLAIGLLGAGLLLMGQLNGTEVVGNQQALQAFWVAEGGLRDTIAQIRTDQGVLRSPPVYTNALGGGVYRVTVSGSNQVFTLLAQARVQNAYHTLAQTVQITTNAWPNAGVVMYSGGTITLAGLSNVTGDMVAKSNISLANTAVTGDILADGNVTITAGVVTGSVDVMAGHTVSGAGTYTQGPAPNPLPSPTDWSAARVTFSNMIAFAASSGATPPNLQSVALYLGGGTNYYKGNLSQKNGGPSIYGPGVVVASGNISVLYSIVGSVTVVAGGTLQLGTGSAPANFPLTNCTFFSGSTSGRFWLDCPNLHFHNCILMSCQNLDARQFVMTDDNSVLLALGSMTLGDNTATRVFTIQGRLEAGKSISADSKTSFTLQASTNLPPLPPGFKGFNQILNTQWLDQGSASWSP